MRPEKVLIRQCECNAQADLNLRWAIMFEGTFSDVMAQYTVYMQNMQSTDWNLIFIHF